MCNTFEKYVSSLPLFNWKNYSCFSLAQDVRAFFGASSLPDLRWIPVKYCEENDQPVNLVPFLLQQYCDRVEDPNEIQHLDLLSLKLPGQCAILATCVDDGDSYYAIVYFGRNNTAVINPLNIFGRGLFSIWRLRES